MCGAIEDMEMNRSQEAFFWFKPYHSADPQWICLKPLGADYLGDLGQMICPVQFLNL